MSPPNQREWAALNLHDAVMAVRAFVESAARECERRLGELT